MREKKRANKRRQTTTHIVLFLYITRERESDSCGYNLSSTSCMGAMKTRSASVGRWVNEVVSFVVFCLLDIVDYLLCLLYKTADYLLEAEWKPCYCLSPKKLITTSRGNILLPHNNCESKILTVSPLQQLRYSCFYGYYLKK